MNVFHGVKLQLDEDMKKSKAAAEIDELSPYNDDDKCPDGFDFALYLICLGAVMLIIALVMLVYLPIKTFIGWLCGRFLVLYNGIKMLIAKVLRFRI